MTLSHWRWKSFDALVEPGHWVLKTLLDLFLCLPDSVLYSFLDLLHFRFHVGMDLLKVFFTVLLYLEMAVFHLGDARLEVLPRAVFDVLDVLFDSGDPLLYALARARVHLRDACVDRGMSLLDAVANRRAELREFLLPPRSDRLMVRFRWLVDSCESLFRFGRELLEAVPDDGHDLSKFQSKDSRELLM